MTTLAAAPASFSWPPQVSKEFRRDEGVVVLIGAAAAGTLVGALTAILTGRVAPAAVDAALWIVFGFTFLLASLTFEELLRARSWRAAGLYSLHLLAFAPWPVSVLFATPDFRAYWTGLSCMLGTLAAFLLFVRPPARIVYRSCACAALIAAITAMQNMFFVFAR